jgi:hypothetical protein
MVPAPFIRLRCARIALGAALAAALVWPGESRQAQAWNPLRSAGRSLGKGLGESFVETAAIPVLRTAEETGKRFVREVDLRLSDRIAQAGGEIGKALDKTDVLVKGQIATVDAAVASRMAQADSILVARIAQIDASANQLVAGALGRLDQTVARAQRAGLGLVRALGEERRQALAQADDILNARIEQIRDVVGRSLEDVDAVLEARFAQIDEAAGRRLANLDVIATKQSHAIEQSLLRIGALAALLLFVVFVLKRLYEDFDRFSDGEEAPEGAPGKKIPVKVLGKTGALFLLRIFAGGLGALLIYILYLKLPLGAERRAAELLDRHRRAFADSQRALDFAGLRHHASQLVLLDPGHQELYRGTERKFEVLRTVFSRPALLRDPAGVRSLVDEIESLEPILRDGDQPDADLQVLKAYISWQVGDSRDDEREAAELCAAALTSRRGDFLLRPLAREYLLAFLHAPPPGPDAAGAVPVRELTQVASAAAPAPADRASPFAHVVAYDELLRELDARSWTAYLAMLDAQIAYQAARARLPRRTREPSLAPVPGESLTPEAAAVRAAKHARLTHAAEVIQAWTAFDTGLRSNAALVGTNVAYAAFTINDVPLVHALWFEASPDAPGLPGPIAGVKDLSLRARLVPVRVEWARRYGLPLDRAARHLLALEEARRYTTFEQRTLAFAAAYIDLGGAALPPSELAGASAARLSAARAAAELGVYRATPSGDRLPLGLSLLGPAAPGPDRESIEALYSRRELLFL